MSPNEKNTLQSCNKSLAAVFLPLSQRETTPKNKDNITKRLFDKSPSPSSEEKTDTLSRSIVAEHLLKLAGEGHRLDCPRSSPGPVQALFADPVPVPGHEYCSVLINNNLFLSNIHIFLKKYKNFPFLFCRVLCSPNSVSRSGLKDRGHP